MLHWSDPKLLSVDSHLRKALVLFIVLLSNLLIGVESFGVTIGIDDIQGYLAIDEPRRSWISVLFFIGIAIPTPIFTYFSNRYTKKVCHAIGLGLLVLGCFICGASFNFYQLLMGRLITGIGAGFIFACTPMIIKRVLDPKWHKTAIMLNTYLGFGLGVAFALLVGGSIAQTSHWRMAFFIDVIMGVICLLLLWLFFKEVRDVLTPRVPVDFWEYVYFLGFLGSLVIFWSQVKAPWNTLGWRSTFSLSFAFLSLFFTTLLILRYEKVKDPLFPFFLLKHKNLFFACFGVMILGALIFGGTTQFIYLLRGYYHYEHITIGLVLSVFGFTILLFGMVPLFLQNVAPIKFVFIGFSLMAISCFINHTMTFLSEPIEIMFFLCLRGAGIGLAMHPLSLFAMEGLEEANLEPSGRLLGSCQQIIGGIGSSLVSTMTVMREAFHGLRYGEQMDIYSARTQNLLRSWKFHLEGVTGQSSYLATKEAKRHLINNVKTQAHIAAFDDVFFVMGWVAVAFVVLLAVHHMRRKKTEQVV